MSAKSSSSVAAELRAESARRNLSAARIATKLGVQRHWVSRRMSGVVPLGVEDVARICDVLDIRPADLYEAADRHARGEVSA